ncbi:MAG TPA: RDD family protein, partial [Pyrinomonadaceae bacterium]|nr:RDD family protein [Pyrinomonadaceae bacterium]
EPEVEVVEQPVVEKTHNLAVVPNPAPVEEEMAPPIKPKRLIKDANDPALNYLDAIPTALLVERREYAAAGTARRLMAAILDLGIILILSSPLMMLDPVTTFDMQNWRALVFSAASFMLIGFLYLTVVTAFTGRTLGMSILSLRIVDARTGLIPTGSQAAGRAIIYLPSLVTGGLLSLYLFLDSERQTLHDRFTRTAVVRA